MIKTGRITFTIGALMFIMVGLLHTFVHFNELAGPELQARFNSIGRVELQGDTVSPWDLFQGISLAMGFFSAGCGVVLLGVILDCPRTIVPHPVICVATLVLLISIGVLGALYLSAFQIIGGVIGVVLFGTTLMARLKSSR